MLAFEKQCGGSQMSLRSELTIRNDLRAEVELQFFALQDGHSAAWQRFPELDTIIKPDEEFPVPFQVGRSVQQLA